MEVTELSLPGLLRIDPAIHSDARGFFLETFSVGRYQQAGIDCKFVQDNHSRSRRHTVRGMHFQRGPGQAKLVRVAQGRIFDVAVDIRVGSPTFGRWAAAELDSERHAQLFVPAGFAHGFCVLSDTADVLYKVSTPYDGATECGFHYGDADVAIAWPTASPVVSARDAAAPPLSALRDLLAADAAP